MGGTPAVTLDRSTLQPIDIPKSSSGAPATPSTSNMPAITLDKSTLTPVNATPEYTRGRTLANMTAAMSGQPMPNPEDQPTFEAGKQAGMASAAVQTGLTAGGELLLAPRAVQILSKVPAGRDPASGRILPWVVKETTEEGPSLARAGVDAIRAAGEAHPLVKEVLKQGLTMLGAGKVAHMLGWLGKTGSP
jgi:hypothetical protein